MFSGMMVKNLNYVKAVAYNIENKNIVTSQTSPPSNSHFVKRKVLITFLANSKNRILRFGFAARLNDLLVNYQLSSNQLIEALVLKQLGKPLQSGINLFPQENKVNLIDVSLWGAKFTYPKSHFFKYEGVVKFDLMIDPMTFEIDARVRNVSLPDLSVNKTIQYVSIKFEYDSKELNILLGKAILSIER